MAFSSVAEDAFSVEDLDAVDEVDDVPPVPDGCVVGAFARRFSRCPGRIRSGSVPMVFRFAAYSRCQPPRTCSVSAIPERESPRTTVYISAVPARDWGVDWGCTSSTDVLAAFLAVVPVFAVVLPAGRTSGVAPPRVSPACTEHTGQARGPWPSRTFSATAICWSLVARSARRAYFAPPYASHVDWVNCSPP